MSDVQEQSPGNKRKRTSTEHSSQHTQPQLDIQPPTKYYIYSNYCYLKMWYMTSGLILYFLNSDINVKLQILHFK